MNLEEAARLMPELARRPGPDHTSFLEAVDQVITGLDQLVMEIQDPKAADVMNQVMAEIKQSRAEFVRVVPAELAQMRAEIISNVDKSASAMLEFQKTHAEAVASLDELQASLPAKMEAARAEMLASIPKPPPAPEPVVINPGEELVARLLDLTRPPPRPRASYTQAAPAPDKPSGFIPRFSTSNIWENWKPGSGRS